MDIHMLREKILARNFESKIKRLEISFASASAPFRSEIREVEREHAAFEREVEAGQASWVQESNGYSYDHGDELAERRTDALDALAILRIAFTFLVYHQWERLAQHWAKAGKSPDHKALVKAAQAAGVSLNEVGLETLRLLVNTAKHNSETAGKELYKIRCDLFKVGFDPNGDNPHTGRLYNNIDWTDQIELTDEHIEEFLSIVRDSAPR